MAFIAAADSPTGRALLAVGNEVSGTTTIHEVGAPAAEATDTTAESAVAAPETMPVSGGSMPWDSPILLLVVAGLGLVLAVLVLPRVARGKKEPPKSGTREGCHRR